MTLPAANVVVSFDKEAINTLFARGASFKSLVDGISNNKDVLLFNHKGNPNFIELKHRFGGKGIGNTIELSLIDPTGEFEKRFITDNAARNTAGYFESATSDRAENPLVGLPKDSGIEGEQLRTQEQRIRNIRTQDDLALAFQQLYRKYKGTKHLYVAYGVGDNLDLWSGPHDMTLIGANLAVEGARRITLKLAATPLSLESYGRRGLFNEPVNIDLEGLSMEVEARSDLFHFDSFGASPVYGEETKRELLRTVYAGLLETEEQLFAGLLSQEKLTNAEFLSKFFDIHQVVTDTIRRFIQQATGNPNVIVLLPNLNLVCRDAIEEVVEDTALRYQNLRDRVNSIVVKEDLAYYGDTFFVSKLYNSVRNTCSLFGLGVGSEEKDSVKRKSTYQPPPIQILVEQDERARITKHSQVLKNWILERSFFSTLTARSNNGIPRYEEVLDSVMENIQKCSFNRYSPKANFFYESDVNLINLWSNKDYKAFPLFGGAGNTIDPNQSVIVYGDVQLIRSYLYGAADMTAFELDREARDQDRSPLDLVPLHPYDKAVLFNQTYNKDIRELTFPPINRFGAFGDVSYIPDEFSIGGEVFSEEAKQLVKEQAIPVFRYNTTNPNVFEMKFNWAPIYFAQLNAGVVKEADRRAATTLAGVLDDRYSSFEFKDGQAVLAYIRVRDKVLGRDDESAQQIKKELAHRFLRQFDTLMTGEAQALAEQAYEAYLAVLNDPNKPIIKIDQLLPGDPLVVMSNFTQQMYRNSMRMSIDTLPMFHLSKHTGTLASPCLVFAQDQPILQTKQRDQTLLNQFYSGEYLILGFTHTINDNGASSSFDLMKRSANLNREDQEEDDSKIDMGAGIL
jgi:hypothetical protein